MYVLLDDDLPKCLLLFCSLMCYDWSECVMSALGTTKH